MQTQPKMTIRAEESWHRKIKSEAALRGITVSWLVRTAVDEWLERNPIKEDKNDGGKKR